MARVVVDMDIILNFKVIFATVSGIFNTSCVKDSTYTVLSFKVLVLRSLSRRTPPSSSISHIKDGIGIISELRSLLLRL